MRHFFLDYIPGLLGAALGSVAGFYLVSWVSWRYGLYAPVVPGAFAGLACGFLSIRDSRIRGILCSLIALAASLVTQWKVLARNADIDHAFGTFLTHLHTESPVTLVMLAIGTFLGYWWGRETTFPWRDRFSKNL
jgi:hypothetical protein